jgi:hypothetical protein
MTQKLIPCNQYRCAFLKNGKCQKCDECGAKPFFVDEDCVRCFNCENKEGALRWGDDTSEDTEDNTEKNKPLTNRDKNLKQIAEHLKELLSKRKVAVPTENK